MVPLGYFTEPVWFLDLRGNPMDAFNYLNIVAMKISNKNLVEISRQNMSSEVVEPIYDSPQLMDLLRVSRRSLQTWRDQGLIKFSAIRGKFYYQHSDIIAMLNVFKINN